MRRVHIPDNGSEFFFFILQAFPLSSTDDKLQTWLRQDGTVAELFWLLFQSAGKSACDNN
jgi:hypothetical protein